MKMAEMMYPALKIGFSDSNRRQWEGMNVHENYQTRVMRGMMMQIIHTRQDDKANAPDHGCNDRTDGQ
jgi:hypothetical protein